MEVQLNSYRKPFLVIQLFQKPSLTPQVLSSLQLAVRVNVAGNVWAVFLILMGNVMHWAPSDRINTHQVCNAGDGVQVSVKAWDFTPFYYFIMVGAAGIAVGFIFLVNPTFRRLNIDSKDTLETRE